LIACAGALSVASGGPHSLTARQSSPPAGPLTFADVAPSAGLTHRTVFGAADKNTYILETTGTGVAFLDYDNDGILDLFFANGTTLAAGAAGAEHSHLYSGSTSVSPISRRRRT
jgi:enediyne biosynthesis protein E4